MEALSAEGFEPTLYGLKVRCFNQVKLCARWTRQDLNLHLPLYESGALTILLHVRWSGRDSNPQPPTCKAGVLPIRTTVPLSPLGFELGITGLQPVVFPIKLQRHRNAAERTRTFEFPVNSRAHYQTLTHQQKKKES